MLYNYDFFFVCLLSTQVPVRLVENAVGQDQELVVTCKDGKSIR